MEFALSISEGRSSLALPMGTVMFGTAVRCVTRSFSPAVLYTYFVTLQSVNWMRTGLPRPSKNWYVVTACAWRLSSILSVLT